MLHCTDLPLPVDPQQTTTVNISLFERLEIDRKINILKFSTIPQMKPKIKTTVFFERKGCGNEAQAGKALSLSLHWLRISQEFAEGLRQLFA